MNPNCQCRIGWEQGRLEPFAYIVRCTYCKGLDQTIEELRRQWEEHLEHVRQFVSELYAVMIDPLESSDLNVKDTCAALIEQAKADRESLAELEALRSAPPAESTVRSEDAPSRPDGRIEFRRDADGLDEVVIRDAEMVHFERMSDQSIWCGVYVGDKRVCLLMYSKNGRSHIDYTADTEPYDKSPIEETAITKDRLKKEIPSE